MLPIAALLVSGFAHHAKRHLPARAACAQMAGASIFRGDESGAAAAAAEAAAAQAVSEAAASKAAHAKLQEDFEYRETSQIVSEELASRVTDETKKAMVKDFSSTACSSMFARTPPTFPT